MKLLDCGAPRLRRIRRCEQLNVALLAGVVWTPPAPVQNQRGYVPNQEAIGTIQVGMDTRTWSRMKLARPSTLATFGGDTWYYISLRLTDAFFAPRATERNILAVEFSGDGKVAGVQRYNLGRGRHRRFPDARKRPRAAARCDPAAVLQRGTGQYRHAGPDRARRTERTDAGSQPASAALNETRFSLRAAPALRAAAGPRYS